MSVTLKRNGQAADPAITGHEVQRLTQSFLHPFELRVRRAVPFDDDESWQNEEVFSAEWEGAVLFDGLLKRNRRSGSTSRDEIIYEMTGLEAKAEQVVLRKNGSGRVVYNATPDDAETGDYDPDLAGLTVGEIIADVLDSMAPELAGTLGDGTAGSAYVFAELAPLTVIPTKTAFNGATVPECLRLLMRHHPQYGIYLDPATHRLRVVDFSQLESKTITVGSDAVIAANLEFSTDDCWTACTVEGMGELVDREAALQPAWDPSLEASWTINKAIEQPETYGRVWRRFSCPDADLAPFRAVGDSPRILVAIDNGWQKLQFVLRDWADIDYEAGEVELPWLARQWSGFWQPAAVTMRYTYRTGPLTARWPRQGYSGTAFSNRGLQREKVLIDHDAMRVTVEGSIDRLESTSVFRDYLLGLKSGELAGRKIIFESGATATITANTANMISIDTAPQPPLQEGDTFRVVVRDDSAPEFEGDTISKMELQAREWLKGHQDERYEGTVPLAGVDFSVRLGQKISFAGTGNPFFQTLDATLVEVVHDFERDRTELVLTSEKTLGGQRQWQQRYEQIVAEQERENLRSEIKLLRRTVIRRHPSLFDGDRDPRLAADPEEPLLSLGKYGDALLLRGHARLEEDNASTPSILITPDAANNSLKLGANFGGTTDLQPVSLDQPEAGSSNRPADAAHRHALAFDASLRAIGNGHTLSHALKEAFGSGVTVQGPLAITWDPATGHLLDVTEAT